MSTWVCTLVLFIGQAADSTRSQEVFVRPRPVKFHNYDQAFEFVAGPWRAVISPQAGGRILEFSKAGKHALWLDDREKEWRPGVKSPISAGRFDYGPELVVTPHPTLWSGDWTGEIVNDGLQVRLTSPRDEAASVQLIREFQMYVGPAEFAGRAPSFSCTQRIVNLGKKTLEVNHWGRSFSPAGGICLVPLRKDMASRFPSKYAMYEDSAVINFRNVDEKIRERGGFLEILAPPRKPKLGFDSRAGWLAYLMPGDTLFIKHFPGVETTKSSFEAAGLTLSVWYPEGPRIELEPIGPGQFIPAGGNAEFTEMWHLIDYPFPEPGRDIDLKHMVRTIGEKTLLKHLSSTLAE